MTYRYMLGSIRLTVAAPDLYQAWRKAAVLRQDFNLEGRISYVGIGKKWPKTQ